MKPRFGSRTLRMVVCLASLALAAPGVSKAHKPSDSFLTLSMDQASESFVGRWDVALRDLDYAIGLDGDQDGAITWGELQSRHVEIANYALARLDITISGSSCEVRRGKQLVDRHSDGAYSVLHFRVDCPRSGEVALDYRLFFDLDPSHRGLLRFESLGAVQTAVLSPEQSRFEVDTRRPSLWREFRGYWTEGVWHIWIGFDHVLFLLTLLFGAVLCRKNRRWKTVESFREAMIEVAGIVTAFTAAHSVTLAMAVLGWVSLPSRWVEAAIAGTVVLAAVNNLAPVLPGRRWVIAFVLGLIHGFGFAGVLADLGLPSETLIVALLGFNVGVEIGQLAIVGVFVPIAYQLRDSWLYRRVIFTLGSIVVALIAGLWLIERGLDIQFLPL